MGANWPGCGDVGLWGDILALLYGYRASSIPIDSRYRLCQLSGAGVHRAPLAAVIRNRWQALFAVDG